MLAKAAGTGSLLSRWGGRTIRRPGRLLKRGLRWRKALRQSVAQIITACQETKNELGARE